MMQVLQVERHTSHAIPPENPRFVGEPRLSNSSTAQRVHPWPNEISRTDMHANSEFDENANTEMEATVPFDRKSRDLTSLTQEATSGVYSRIWRRVSAKRSNLVSSLQEGFQKMLREDYIFMDDYKVNHFFTDKTQIQVQTHKTCSLRISSFWLFVTLPLGQELRDTFVPPPRKTKQQDSGPRERATKSDAFVK